MLQTVSHILIRLCVGLAFNKVALSMWKKRDYTWKESIIETDVELLIVCVTTAFLLS